MKEEKEGVEEAEAEAAEEAAKDHSFLLNGKSELFAKSCFLRLL